MYTYLASSALPLDVTTLTTDTPLVGDPGGVDTANRGARRSNDSLGKCPEPELEYFCAGRTDIVGIDWAPLPEVALVLDVYKQNKTYFTLIKRI